MYAGSMIGLKILCFVMLLARLLLGMKCSRFSAIVLVDGAVHIC